MYSNGIQPDTDNAEPIDLPLWSKAFFTALRASGVVSKAAGAAGIDRRTAYKHKDNAEFMERWHEALEDYADALETEATRRAVEGVAEPVFYRGVEVGTIRKFSDNILIEMLRAKRPDQYKQRIEQTNIPTPDDFANMSDEELDRYAAKMGVKNARR